MLTDHLSYYKLNNKSTSIPRRKKFTKLKDCQIFIVINVLGYLNIGVHLFQKEKSNIFF